MKVLFISRKRKKDTGGLSRFGRELILRFDHHYLLSPDRLRVLFKLPFLDFEVIHLCDGALLPLGVIFKKMFGKPLTVTVHGLDLTYSKFWYQRMLKILLPIVNAVITDSQFIKPIVIKLGVSEGNVFKINPGIDTDQFKYSKSISLPVKTGNIILLTVGNLVKRKGYIWFIKNIFNRLDSKYVYLIVGIGPERENIKKLISELNIEDRIYLLGRLNDSCLSYIFKRSDIYVCPNIHIKGDYEGFGIAAGEAAAMGLPVIASNVDGINEVIINNKNGILVSPIAEEFIKAINKLRDLHLRKEIGDRAKEYTRRNYKWEKTADHYKRIFNKIASKFSDRA